jgi:hypothetical protein
MGRSKILIVQFLRKELIQANYNFGMAPNRLLIKAFLKKAVNFESATLKVKT